MPAVNRLVERVWFGDGVADRLARAALAPLSAAFGGVARARNALYDAGFLHAHLLALPAISVGNLSVGGTGKTPVAAWLAGMLADRGARPAVVLRGYGDDEPLVHARLTPRAVVVTNPDRVAGVAEAARQGADVAVLDDAFQHRRAARDADLVLVSADRWPERVRTLPGGPFRERLAALRRASLVLVTRKAAGREQAAAVVAAITAAAPGVPSGVVHLAPAALVHVAEGHAEPLGAIAGQPVVALCGIGDPGAFARQLRVVGATVKLQGYADHHAFTGDDINAAASAARRLGAGTRVVCTLKDAVKLAGRWPTDAPALWYISQHVYLEAGHEALERLLDSMLRARSTAATAAR